MSLNASMTLRQALASVWLELRVWRAERMLRQAMYAMPRESPDYVPLVSAVRDYHRAVAFRLEEAIQRRDAKRS